MFNLNEISWNYLLNYLNDIFMKIMVVTLFLTKNILCMILNITFITMTEMLQPNSKDVHYLGKC